MCWLGYKSYKKRVNYNLPFEKTSFSVESNFYRFHTSIPNRFTKELFDQPIEKTKEPKNRHINQIGSAFCVNGNSKREVDQVTNNNKHSNAYLDRCLLFFDEGNGTFFNVIQKVIDWSKWTS